ncbi:anti-sigma factor domain-containing protein, partial [Halobacillus halophilus]|uniref:anti-sigma factor domain-containing protein n=1 Tax=Halobacillus halophilus TaxID=1570 RepID=UPI001CD4818C
MRKGIVMEHKKGYTIVMTHDGSFHRALRLHEAEVGMEVHFQAIPNNKHLRPLGWLSSIVPWKIGIIALVLVLASLPFYINYGSSQAYAYVNIDINPSLELKLNDRLQVIEITPRNEEAEKLMEMFTGWKKKDVSEVAFEMITISRENGWMNQRNQVLIGISYLKSNPTASLAKSMEQVLSARAKDLSVAAYNIPSSLREQALEANQSVNEWVAKQLSNEQSDTKGAASIDLMSEEKEMIRSFFEEKSKRDSSANNSSSSLKNIESHGEGPSPTADNKSVNSKEKKNVDHSSDSQQKSSGDQRGTTDQKSRDTNTPPSSNLTKDKVEKLDQKDNSKGNSSEEKKKEEPNSNSAQSKDKPNSNSGESDDQSDKGSSEDKKKDKPKSNPGQSKEKPDKPSSKDDKKDRTNSNSDRSKDKSDKGSSEDK